MQADGQETGQETSGAPPGALIALDGTLNLRDLGGWPTASGAHTVTRAALYRSDRLSHLTTADHEALDRLGIVTVVDLRYEAERAAHPSKLWPAVEQHVSIPMGGGDPTDQRSFVERALDGELDGITDDDVGESYVELLTDHAAGFGAAMNTLLDRRPALFHCTAGKDRTGLLSMLLLRTVGVNDHDVLRDFALSNEYRARVRIEELRPTFADHGLDIEDFRPAISAPVPALSRAMRWIDEQFGDTAGYLSGPCELTDPIERIGDRLLDPTSR